MYSTHTSRKTKNNRYSHYCYYQGKKWYKRLKPSLQGSSICLLNDYPEYTLNKKVVVGIETLNGKEHSRLFALFNSYIELYEYQTKLSPDQRYFYEIIFGDLPQKPHFDIDIKIPECPEGKNFEKLGNEVKDDVIANILAVGKEHGIIFNLEKDILVYTSHGKAKRSYHIVVHHHCHTNHEQAKAFYKDVTGKMSAENAVYIDSGVYSSKQNFRILGSQKIGSYRPKKFCEDFTFLGKEIKHMYDVDLHSEEYKKLECFKESLVCWISDCEYLPSFQDPIKREQYVNQHTDMDYGDLSEASIEEAIKLMNDARITKGSKFPFVIREVQGNVISLRRLRPSYCFICKRIHEHENPYLLVIGMDVHFCCRRSGTETYILGTLSESIPSRESSLLELPSDGDGVVMCFGKKCKPPQKKKILTLSIIKEKLPEKDALEIFKD